MTLSSSFPQKYYNKLCKRNAKKEKAFSYVLGIGFKNHDCSGI